MADVTYTSTAPVQQFNDMTHKASELAEKGDLLWYDTTNHVLRGAAAFADAGTALQTQAGFAAVFAGLSASHQAADNATPQTARVQPNRIVTFPCASTTVEVGDYFAPTWTAGTLSSQQLTKVTSPDAAIARAVKRYGSATTEVKVRLISAFFEGKQFLREEAIGASTAAAGNDNTNAGALPTGTARVYPTSAADDAKGVIISTSDKVTGRVLYIGNGVSNKILKVYPPSGGVINGAAANAAFSSVSGKGVIAVCLSGSGNTWLMW